MATRDLTPQDESNKAYVPDEDGAGVRGQTGDSDLDAHTEQNDSVLPADGVHSAPDDGDDSDDKSE
jgi:hypothetical protein